MSGNTHRLCLRLLKEGLSPESSLRDGVDLLEWPKIEGARIALDTMGGNAPKWSKFLELTPEEKAELKNAAAYGLVFLKVSERWFAASFGMGHIKLDPDRFEQDFGLKTVLNAVDPKKLKSADIRTPDENTMSRRSQTSVGSDQTAFAIDVERDIVRGLAGQPRDPNFAVRVAGSDSLTLDRKMTISDLPTVCADVLDMYHRTDYKTDFEWIDHIRHIREKDLIDTLNGKLVAALDSALKTGSLASLHLAFPVIYDPEKCSYISFKGFRSQSLYNDLDMACYLEDMKANGRQDYEAECLTAHKVHEVDDQGRDSGQRWKILDCIGFEVDHDGGLYVLSGGRWYQINTDLAADVRAFFERAPRFDMPAAAANENEQQYNERLSKNEPDLLCMDRKLVKATGAASQIEVCDFIRKDKALIHVKDEASSSRLSHLFNQGTVSAHVLKMDGAARDKFRAKMSAVEAETSKTGFNDIICGKDGEFLPSDHTVVYAVLSSGSTDTLPFFSLVTFRQAALHLQSLGFKYAFAWVPKTTTSVGTKVKKKKAKGEKKKSASEGNESEAA